MKAKIIYGTNLTSEVVAKKQLDSAFLMVYKRRLVKKMHLVMQGLKFKLARDNTFIGKISKGFDFLGYRFNRQASLAWQNKRYKDFFHVLPRFMSKTRLTSTFWSM